MAHLLEADSSAPAVELSRISGLFKLAESWPAWGQAWGELNRLVRLMVGDGTVNDIHILVWRWRFRGPGSSSPGLEAGFHQA